MDLGRARRLGLRLHHRNLRIPKRYNRRLRRVFYVAAPSSSLRIEDTSRTFYDRNAANGSPTSSALTTYVHRVGDTPDKIPDTGSR